jgi:hypothetical protein
MHRTLPLLPSYELVFRLATTCTQPNVRTAARVPSYTMHPPRTPPDKSHTWLQHRDSSHTLAHSVRVDYPSPHNSKPRVTEYFLHSRASVQLNAEPATHSGQSYSTLAFRTALIPRHSGFEGQEAMTRKGLSNVGGPCNLDGCEHG